MTKETVSGYDSQDIFNEDIAKFIMNSMVPLRTIEDPYFVSLFDKLKISRQGLKIMSRRSLSRKINSLFESHNIQIKQELQISFVCTIADIWSWEKKKFSRS